MASTEYDQYDNEYKPVKSAALVEANRESDDDRERKQREKEVQEDFERSNREREAAEADREYRKQLEESKREAAREREQEVLKRQQEARDLRQKKKREQQEAEEAERDYREQLERSRREAERDAELEREQEKLKRQQEARNLRSGKREEQESAAKKRRREEAGKQFGFKPLNPTGSKEELERASFEEAENKRMWQEFEEKQKTRYARIDEHAASPIPKKKPAEGGAFEPGALGFGKLVLGKAKVAAKTHVERSLNDVFLAPMGLPSRTLKNAAGEPVRAVRSSKPSPILTNLLGGTAKSPRASPRGLLSMGSFADPSPLLFTRPKRVSTPKKKKSGKGKRAAPSRRSAPPRRRGGDIMDFIL